MNIPRKEEKTLIPRKDEQALIIPRKDNQQSLIQPKEIQPKGSQFQQPGPAGPNPFSMYSNLARAAGKGVYGSTAGILNTAEQWRSKLEEEVTEPLGVPNFIQIPKTGIAPIDWFTNLSNELNKARQEKDESIFQQGQEAYEELAQDMDDAIQDSGGMNKYAKAITEGLGSAAIDLPAMAAMGLPVFMGLKGGADAIQYGESLIQGVVVGGLEGAALHTIFKWLNRIPALERRILGGGIMGGSAVGHELGKPSEERDWARAVADITIGAGLTWRGPKGKQFRRDFYRNIWEDMSQLSFRMEGVRKKALVRKFAKMYEMDPRGDILQVLKENKDEFGLDEKQFEEIADIIGKAGVRQTVREEVTNKAGREKETGVEEIIEGIVKEKSALDFVDKNPERVESVLTEIEKTFNDLAKPTTEAQLAKKVKLSQVKDLIKQAVGKSTAPDHVAKTVEAKKEVEKIPPSTLKPEPKPDYGPADVGSVALEMSSESFGSWLAQTRKGEIVKASEWLKAKEKEGKLSEAEEYALEDITDFLENRTSDSAELHRLNNIHAQDRGIKKERIDNLNKLLDQEMITFEKYFSEMEKIGENQSFEKWLREEGLLEQAAQKEAIRKMFDEIPGLYEKDPMTGKDHKILPELMNTVDWLAQNQKGLERHRNYTDKVEEFMDNMAAKKRGLVGKFSITDMFNIIDGHGSGRAFVRFNSIQELERTVWGIDRVEWIAKKLRYNEADMKELPFIIENKDHPLRKETKYTEIIEEFEKWTDDAHQVLKGLGGVKKKWQERLEYDLIAEMKHPDTTSERRSELQALIRKVNRTEWVHIPARVLIEKAFGKDNPNRDRVMRSFLNIKTGMKRNTIRLEDLIISPENPNGFINRGDVHIRDIMSQYGIRYGKDKALLEIRKELIRDGLAIEKSPNGKYKKKHASYVSASFDMPVLYGTKIHPTVEQALKQISGTEYAANFMGRGFQKTMNVYKVLRFYNPLFLPMYDTIQATMGTGLGWMRPQHLGNAIKDVWKHTDTWKQLSEYGLFSQPFPTIGKIYEKAVLRASRSKTKNLADWHNLLPNWMLRDMISGLQTTAWTMDQMVRVASARSLMKKGYSMKDAAEQAALFHGDYADVPTSTRRALNAMWFTPTFKVAMARFHKEMIKGTARRIGGDKDRTSLNMAYSLATTLGMMSAFDLFMTQGMGFERDEWGWKYTKRLKDENKDFVIGFSGPHNIWNNEMKRIVNAVKPINQNPIKSWMRNALGSKIHPLYRTATAIVNNEDYNAEPEIFATGRPVPIWKRFDSPEGKSLAFSKWFAKEVFPVLTVVDPSDRESSAQKTLREQTSKMFEIATRAFTFRYKRRPTDQRIMKKIGRINDEMKNQILDFGTEGAGKDQVEAMIKEIELLQQSLEEEREGKLFPNE
ncbi:MAG: hypothetical protein GY804_01050 [Alphaproteobacteria bacterium]|nr:hypothetical protein [Alphaproteobacteria bacterium]